MSTGTPCPPIFAIPVKKAGFHIVSQISRQDFILDAQLKRWIEHRAQYLNTLIEVARHPVCAGDINLFIAAVLKVEDPAMLQKTPYDAAHNDIVADSGHAGT